MGTDKLAVNW